MDRMFSRGLPVGGHSLIELLLVLTVLVVVVSLVLPFAARFRHQIQLRQATDRLLAGLNQARAEAIVRGVPVSLCPARSGSRSCGGSYREGWILFTDPDGDAVYDPGEEELLAVAPELPAGFTVSKRDGIREADEGIRYLSDGTAGQSLSHVYCAPPASQLPPRTIVLNHVGRARLAVGEGQCPV